MNQELILGNWNQIKGELKVKWGKLTDDDLMQVKGQKDILMGKLVEYYGNSKEEASVAVTEFFNSFKAEKKMKE